LVILLNSAIAWAGLPEGRDSFEWRMFDDDSNPASAIAPTPAPAIAPAIAPAPIIETKALEQKPKFQWGSALWQSAFFLGIQHAFRFSTEPGTRAELKGPYFRDWGKSIIGYDRWEDSDPFIVNYVGHPMMGAVTGFIQVQNDPAAHKLQVGLSKDYWKSRAKAFAFSFAYSTFFELGPVGEASLGNVGLDHRTGGMVDIVVTPTLGLGWQVAEDMMDRYVAKFIERKVSNRSICILVRTFANPGRSFANLLRFEVPWHRDDRGGIWRRNQSR
jgi:hypothetical protein